ncbi:MAG: ABC transporter permease, partial [Rhodobacteraceae bacterium]|nr:ABC transporter permease [Paracoccaceae bacterium]
MTTVDPNFADAAAREARRARLFARINKADAWFKVLGMAWMTPILRAVAGDNPKAQAREVWKLLGVPLLAIAIFLGLWATLAPRVQTSLGAIPGPLQVWEQVENLHADHVRTMQDAADFYARQDERNAERIANGQEPRYRSYTGAPTYYQQIWTSIKTVFFGFMLGTIIAVPLGIAGGLSQTANAAMNPLIQIFK